MLGSFAGIEGILFFGLETSWNREAHEVDDKFFWAERKNVNSSYCLMHAKGVRSRQRLFRYDRMLFNAVAAI
jgi:hypothetical protein